MNKKVFKAIIPAAGFGTRMLPFAKSVPKELIPLVDTPVLQYVVEEAVAAGVKEILIIISRGKEAIIRHFETAEELETRLAESGKTELLAAMQRINSLADITFVYQEELKGLGDAVRLGAEFAGNDPCLVMLGDTVMDSDTERSVAGQLVDVYDRFGHSVVALERVAPEKVSSYGIAAGEEIAKGVLQLSELVEKPSPEKAPGNLAVAARYLFTPAIFAELKNTAAGLHGEIQLTDAIRKLMNSEKVLGCCIAGRRFDLGSVAGFVAANVEFALRRPELQEVLGRRIMDILKKNVSQSVESVQ
jgi:UTP--glucose-1-phosphate uridylyltransferase